MNVRTSARSRLAAALAGIGSITLVLGGVALVAAPSASAEPTTGGKNDCRAAGIPGSPLKVDPVKDGTYKGAKGFEVKVTVKGLTFDFESSRLVYGVAVKGGPGLNPYEYLPKGATSGTGLRANINPNTKQPYELSHITFCYNPCPPTAPPTKPTIPTLPPTVPTIPTLPTSPTAPTSPTVPTNPPSTPTPSVPTEQPSTTPTEQPSNPAPTGTPSAPGDESPTVVVPTDVDAGSGGDIATTGANGGGSGGPLAIGVLALGAALLAAGGWVVIRRRGQHSI